MSIIKFPSNIKFSAAITCVMCGRQIRPVDATLGPINAEGSIALLCNGHLWDGGQLINKLADYLAEERKKLRRNSSNNLTP
jgi:hypothetical protein